MTREETYTIKRGPHGWECRFTDARGNGCAFWHETPQEALQGAIDVNAISAKEETHSSVI